MPRKRAPRTVKSSDTSTWSIWAPNAGAVRDGQVGVRPAPARRAASRSPVARTRRKAAWSRVALKSPARTVGVPVSAAAASRTASSSSRQRPTWPGTGGIGWASWSRTGCPRTSATAPGIPIVAGTPAVARSGKRLRMTLPSEPPPSTARRWG